MDRSAEDSEEDPGKDSEENSAAKSNLPGSSSSQGKLSLEKLARSSTVLRVVKKDISELELGSWTDQGSGDMNLISFTETKETALRKKAALKMKTALRKKTLFVLSLSLAATSLWQASANQYPRGYGESGRWMNPRPSKTCPSQNGKVGVCAEWFDDMYPGRVAVCCVFRERLRKNDFKDCQAH